MYPILFRLGSVTIYSYGFMLALAFIAGTVLAYFEAKRRGLNPDITYDIALLALVGGIVGARLFYVLAHWKDFAAKPLTVITLWQGGLVFYGGLLGGIAAVLIYVWLKKLNPWTVADMAAPSLALGSAIGRIGCFLNGCCFGKPTRLFLGIVFPNLDNLPRHPTQLYDAFYNLVIFGVLWAFRKKIKRQGTVFWFYLMLYGLFRFVVEFFRTSARPFLGMTLSQTASIGLFLLGLAVIYMPIFIQLKRKVLKGKK